MRHSRKTFSTSLSTGKIVGQSEFKFQKNMKQWICYIMVHDGFIPSSIVLQPQHPTAYLARGVNPLISSAYCNMYPLIADQASFRWLGVESASRQKRINIPFFYLWTCIILFHSNLFTEGNSIDYVMSLLLPVCFCMLRSLLGILAWRPCCCRHPAVAGIPALTGIPAVSNITVVLQESLMLHPYSYWHSLC